MNDCQQLSLKEQVRLLTRKIYQQPWLTLIHCSNFDYDASLTMLKKPLSYIVYLRPILLFL